MDYVDYCSIHKGIPIKYINATNEVDFDVVVFTKNYFTSPETAELYHSADYYVAWQILRGQTSVSSIFPEGIEVGSTYNNNCQWISCGPFKAKLGSTWEMRQDTRDSTPVLEQGEPIL
jgi:hypothetical protein